MASGQGANRIAFLYYSRHRSREIGDRVLLLNTSASDMKPDEPLREIFQSSSHLKELYEKIKRRRIGIFGRAPSGAGNNFFLGEKEAREDFDTIRRYVSALDLKGNDVLLGISTLGGGTGNGSLPYITHRLRHDPPKTVGRIKNLISLGILPYRFEGAQRHFNALCGLSRLLHYNSHQNSAMVVLVENSQVESHLERGVKVARGRYEEINREIINAIRMLIAPGGEGSRATIDISDYYQLPGSLGVYHFTPCLSLNNDPEVFGLDSMIEAASARPMAPMDIGTATMAYFVVSAPQEIVDRGEITQESLEEVSGRWAKENMAGKEGGLLRYSSLVSSPEAEKVDVMLLVGGFSLSRILERSLPHYYSFKESLEEGSQLERVEGIEHNLKEYHERVEKKRKALGEIKGRLT